MLSWKLPDCTFVATTPNCLAFLGEKVLFFDSFRRLQLRDYGLRDLHVRGRGPHARGRVRHIRDRAPNDCALLLIRDYDCDRYGCCCHCKQRKLQAPSMQ